MVLCPNPTYPIHAFGFIMSGGVIRSLPVEPDDGFIPALERACSPLDPEAAGAGPQLSVEPDGAGRRRSISTRTWSAFAQKHDIIILSDLAYSEIYFDGNPPPSVLQVPGAIDIAVEFTSMSKTFSMPGWRIGFAVGNERLIAALARVKSYLDYGAFTPIQVAAAAALNGDGADIAEVRDIYHKRRDVMVESFGRAGWTIPAPAASMFAWAPIPEQFRHLGSLEFSKLLIEQADVAVAPGVGFGEYGDEYVRIALVENEQRIRQAARNIKRFLSTSAKQPNNVVPLSAHR